jgi:capsular polysaccharide biosynthesis protein
MTTDDRTTIDVADWMRVLARGWWIVVGLVVIGAVAGGVLTLASPKQYTAASSVYIGQTTDANGNPMAGLNSNSKAATELLGSQAALNEAAKRTGMGETAKRLRAGLTVSTPSQVVKATSSIVNLVNMSVVDTRKARATKAANELAAVLLEHIGSGTEQKITLLKSQLEQGQTQLAAAEASSAAAGKALDRIAKGGGSAAARDAAAAPYLAIVQAAATEIGAWAGSNQRTQLLLLTAQQVELPRVLHEAATPDSPSGPDLKLNVAAGALAGLVIGIIAAFAWRRAREH